MAFIRDRSAGQGRVAARSANNVKLAHSKTANRNRRVAHTRGELGDVLGCRRLVRSIVGQFPNPAQAAPEPRSEPTKVERCSGYIAVLPNNMISGSSFLPH